MAMNNQKDEVPFEYYTEILAGLDADSIAVRCGIPFTDGIFKIKYFYDEYEVKWPNYALSSKNPDAFALTNLPMQTMLLRYLIDGKALPTTGTFKTFMELPWGEVYRKPFTGRCITRAAFAFGTKIERFREIAEKLSAEKISSGTAAYKFEVVPGYFMQIIVWAGDDEFPPSSQILYSDNFAVGFTAEDRVVLGDLLISYLKREMNKEG